MKYLVNTHKNQGNTLVLHSGIWLLPFLLLASGLLSAQPKAAGNAQVLIDMPGQTAMNAQWSPDGKTIAFTSENHNGIWLSNVDGSNIRLLTADEAVGFGYTWSPDGQFILGRTTITENRRRLHQVKIFDSKSSSYEILLDKTRGLNGLPLWAPEGSQVAIVKDGKVELKSSDRLPKQKAVSNQPFVYPVQDKLFVLNAQNKNSDKIASFDGRMIFNLSPSPDGKKVSFQVQGLGLHVMDNDGKNLKHIGFGEKAAWLPDSRYAIVSVTEDDGYNITGAVLHVVDALTGDSYPITNHLEIKALKPSVSPDGKSVIFDNPDDGNIYILKLE
jgi:WD40 repeat protein